MRAAMMDSEDARAAGAIMGAAKAGGAPARPADIETATIRAAARGDQSAFERLYRAHAGRIYGLCLRLTGHRETAEDCVQETFVSAWRGLARFEARSAFSTWLHRIAVNTVLARHRARGGVIESTGEEAIELQRHAGEDTPPIDVEAAIAALPPGARHVLVMVGLYGFSHEEAADSLGIAVGTSKAQFHRARRLLASRLGLAPEGP
jgi:RNA polymerase sigma-70 factor, ECF subfamily